MLSYSSSFQTFAVNTYLNSLAKKTKTKITVGSVDVELFKTVSLNNIYVEDLHQDTLLFAENILVDIEEFSIGDKRIKLEQAVVSNTYFNLKKYSTDNVSNLQFIIDHFKTSDTTKGKWLFAINSVQLENVRFNYNNEHLVIKEQGIDFNHIGLTNVNAKLDDIELIENIDFPKFPFKSIPEF